MGTEREETFTIVVREKALASIKADLIHAFLSVRSVYVIIIKIQVKVNRSFFKGPTNLSFLQIADLSHSVTSPLSFRVEYRRGGFSGPATMFQRNVRFQVDIAQAGGCVGSDSDSDHKPRRSYNIYCITFVLISGTRPLLPILAINLRLRIITHSFRIFKGPVRRFKRICEHIQAQIIGKRPPSTLSSRRKGSSSIIGGDMSDSSSCGGSSERLFVPPPSSLLHHPPSSTLSADDTSERSAVASAGNGCTPKSVRGSSAPPSTVPSPQSGDFQQDNNANIPGPSLELNIVTVDTPTMKRRADSTTSGSARVLANGRKPPSFSSSPKDKV